MTRPQIWHTKSQKGPRDEKTRIPELAAALTICGPLAWSVLLASEMFGMQEGWGG